MRPIGFWRFAGFATSAATSSLLQTRQDDPNSTCLVYGIDYVDGGSYFIDSGSTSDFTAVQQFDNCNNDTASILLVQQSTEEEWECSSVPTVPDNTSQMSTCPLEKDQMTSGQWSILVIGNNADGNPFAYERDFNLTVGPQTTTTIAPTVTFTLSSTPVTNSTTTSTETFTSTVQNSRTVTASSKSNSATVVPSPVTRTTTKTIFASFTRWEHTQNVVTATVVPSCTVPPRPSSPDPRATFKPTIIPLPPGLHWQRGETRAVDPEQALARLRKHRAQRSSPKKAKRSVNAPTVTSTASTAINTTVTQLHPTSTQTFTVFTSAITFSTLPPVTVEPGAQHSTITAPTPTNTVTTAVWSRTVVTSTLSLQWTRTITSTPSAVAATCKAQGGHFGSVGSDFGSGRGSGFGKGSGSGMEGFSRKRFGWGGFWW